MKKFRLFIIASILLFSNVIILENFNAQNNGTVAQNVNYSVGSDEYFDSLSPNDTWIEATIDNDSDGQIDYLTIKLGITTTEYLDVYGILKDPMGNWIGYTVNATIESTVEQEITLSFYGGSIYASGYSGVYQLFLMFLDSSSSPNEVDARFVYSTNSYIYIQFERPSAIFNGATDYGVDTDNDTLYNEIHIDFLVNVSETGTYLAALMLNSNDPFNESSMDYIGMGMAELSPGDNQVITAIVPTMPLFVNKLNGPYSYGFVYLMKQTPDYEMAFQQFKQDFGYTQAYNYSQFDLASAYFTGGLHDHPLDTMGDSKFEGVEILVELNVTDPGRYTTEIYYQIGTLTRYMENDSIYSAGLHNVSLFISDTTVYANKLNESIRIDRLALTDSSYQIIHTLNPNYRSQNYTYTDFNPPGLLLTERYFDQGVDTDNDSYFNELQISVEVNVTKNDTYYFDISLAEPVGIWEYDGIYLDPGLQNVTFSFPMNNHYQKQINTSFVVEHLYISVDTSGMYQQIHSATDVYTTRVYYFNEFDRPNILFTNRFWDYPVDINNNSLYDLLVIDAEVEVFEGGVFNFGGDIHSVTSPVTYYFYTNHQEYLDIGIHNISLIFTDVHTRQLDCSYHLNYAYVRDEGYQLINEVYDPYDTAFYYYNDFERPMVSMEYVKDYGYAESGSTAFNFIIVEFDITFNQPVSDYTVEMTAEANSISYGFGMGIYGSFAAGTTRIDFGIDPSSITESTWQTSFDISVRVYDNNMQVIYEVHHINTTQTYYSHDFIQQTTTTTTTDSPEHSTTSDKETTPRPGLTPGYTVVLSLLTVIVLPIFKKRGR